MRVRDGIWLNAENQEFSLSDGDTYQTSYNPYSIVYKGRVEAWNRGSPENETHWRHILHTVEHGDEDPMRFESDCLFSLLMPKEFICYD